ncbi:MATH domain-containing protein [Sulfurovum sp. CS9]|uniref:MATH domain-containing protein n=1 Tax=Sulfurovum sp. CS9 TaxID=3391146 RepID=UPI0039ED7C94
MSFLKSSFVTALALLPILSFSEGMSEAELESLAKTAQNPIASMISLPFQNNTNLNIGPNDETQNILNIQPVWPFEINDDWNFITRTIVPVVSNPDVLTGEGRVDGIGDTLFTGFLSPKDSGSITWGVGPAILMPTATKDVLGQDTWGAGISAVALAMPGNWVVGSLVSNIWSVGGGDADINLFTWQYFINYNLDDGWYLVSAPIITANWEADSDHRWKVPFGGGVGKIFRVGNQPINAQLSLYNNVITPDDYGPEWQVRAQFQFMFPK